MTLQAAPKGPDLQRHAKAMFPPTRVGPNLWVPGDTTFVHSQCQRIRARKPVNAVYAFCEPPNSK